MSKFFLTSGLKWIDPKDFSLNKYTSNSSKGCDLEVDLEYPKELLELHFDYTLAPNKIEIKREMLSKYQKKKIADLCNIPTGNVKKLVPKFFDEKKYVLHYQNLQFYLRLGLKLKAIHRCGFESSCSHLRNRIDVKLLNNNKDASHKMHIKTKLYVAQNF